jgi:mannose-6-phosphate isomerase-like protein (cupin superfamily)
MKIRRVVTGHDAQGKSVFVSDGATPRAHSFEHFPGHAAAQVWSVDGPPVVPHEGGDPTAARGSVMPPAGGNSLLLVDFPPDAVMGGAADPAAAFASLVEALPGLMETFEPASPGMHTTDTVDYAIVLSGEIWLELDDGAVKLVKAGDVVVQHGTRHAWRNRSEQVVRVAFMMTGASRRAG